MALNENNEYINNNDHLLELGGSDYEIADGEPDIKGWDVKNEDGQKIGTVDELLFDPQSRKVRYIIIDPHDNELQLDRNENVLVPIGVAKIYDGERQNRMEAADINGREPGYKTDPDHYTVVETNSDEEMRHAYENDEMAYNPEYDDNVVIVPVTADQLRQLPAYNKNNITPETESHIRRVFDGTNSETNDFAYNREDFYEHEHFNERGYFDRPVAADESIILTDEKPQIEKTDGEA